MLICRVKADMQHKRGAADQRQDLRFRTGIQDYKL